jgi:hypothetical protein
MYSLVIDLPSQSTDQDVVSYKVSLPAVGTTIGYELSQVYYNDANEHLAIAKRV